MKEKCFFGSIDLKDAFFSIPVKETSRKYLRFTWNDKLYQFKCLAQGLNTCPRIFTKIMKCVFSTLRKQGHCNTAYMYIDDSLLIGETYDDCKVNIQDTVKLCDRLGLTIHSEKSVSIPTRKIQYLGFILNSNKMNCELMLTYDTPALRQTGSRNLMGPKTFPTICGTYMKLVT
jgi:hypothetical protein